MSKKIKIAVIGSRGYPYVYSGYETFIRETFERISNEFEVHIYCHSYLFEDKPKIVNNIHLHYLPAIKTASLCQLSQSFLSTCHAVFKGYDIILYVNTANGPFGLITKLLRIKTAIITDGLEWLRPKWSGFGSKYFYWSSKFSTKVFDVLISDSKEMRKIYLEEFNADSVVIEYGADIKRSTKPDLIKQFNLEPNDYYLVVARLIPDNNGDIIVKGFNQAKTCRKLVVVGDVPYPNFYSKEIKKNASDKVIFLGYVEDQKLLQELYNNSYIYIHGHEHGGTNPSLLQALAYGSAVLALDTRFNREVLDDDKYAKYFQKNASSITAIIDELDSMSDSLITLKSISVDRINERYTWERIARKYKELFFDILS